jgi:hypothetical protein
MYKKYFAILCSGVVLTAFSCSSGSRVVKPEKPETGVRNFALMNEEFDPLALEDDDVVIEQKDSSPSSATEMNTVTTAAAQDSIGDGYRIQLTQIEDNEEAKNIQRDALLSFSDHEVYSVFDPPFYKVRIGDFVNWHDAEKLQQLAIKKGYKGAWIIPCKINLKRAYHWMDEL